MAEINDLEIVDDDNTDRFPEGQAPSTVNNGARQLEGIVARWHKDTNASKSSTGSANAYVFAADQTLTAYYDGLEIAFDANFTNDGAATLDVDGLGAQAITLVDGSALTGSEIVQGQKAVVIFDGTNWQLLNPSFSGLNALPVGSTFPYVGTVAPSGFVLAEGRTIGNAASGGTERAAADTEELFILIWNSIDDTNAPVSGGRGSDAASDYAANKNIKVPDLRGRSVIGSGIGPDTAEGGGAGTEREQGSAGGVETYVQKASEVGEHDHLLATLSRPIDDGQTSEGDRTVKVGGSQAANYVITNTGGDAMDWMHPWRALTNIISLGTGLQTGAPTVSSRDASNDTTTTTGTVTARTLGTRGRDRIQAEDYGIVGDDSTDNSDAIDAMLADIAPTTDDGRRVYFGKGIFQVSRPVVLPTFVSFHGEGSRQSVLKAASGFTGSQVLQLGSTGRVFDCWAENMRISASDIPGLLCVYSNRINEKSGLRDVTLSGFDQTACFVEFAGSNQAQNYFFQNVEAFPSNADEISISSITQTGGTATATSTNHGWAVGDIFTPLGANEVEYQGAFKVTATPTANTFEFVVESGAPAAATGTITASRCISYRFDMGGAAKSELYGLHAVKASGPGIGCLVQRSRGSVIQGFHAEGFGVGICTGLEDSTNSLAIKNGDLRPNLEVGVQLSGGIFAGVNIENITSQNGSVTTIWDSYYGLRWTNESIAKYSTGEGIAPDGALFTLSGGEKALQLRGPMRPRNYTVATVPNADVSGAGAMIYVTDEAGGAVPAFSDGTDWRRVTDRAIIS